MNMKIALITIHNVTNYGAILQAFATNEILSRYGKVEMIDYQKNHLSNHMDLIRFNLSFRGFKMLVHDVLNLRSRYKMVSRFKRFIEDNMILTKNFSSEQLTMGKASGFDLYVCGSDQIWNPEIVSADKTLDPIFFLSFAPKGVTKISYASSTGHHIFNEEEKQEVKKLLHDFKNISIREKDGQDQLLKIFPDREINLVLDPTLLLSKKEWLMKFNIAENQHGEDYILVYSVPRTSLIKKAISFFAEKLNLKVVSIDKMLLPITNGVDHINHAGPIEFLQLYANASFVISDSFHGLCYALNFEKPFVAVSSNKVGNRQENLLALLGIDDRLVKDEADFLEISVDLDYNKGISEKLNLLREKSLEYIDSSISETH